MTINAEAFRRVWASLDEATQEDVKAKARWEQVSLSAALVWMRPDLRPMIEVVR